MKTLIAQAASSEAMNTAWMTIAEYGVVGSVLVIILGAFLFLVNRVMNRLEKRFDDVREDDKEKTKRTNEIMGEKDDKLETARQEMQEIAVDAVKHGTIMNERVSQVLNLLEDVLEILRQNGGHSHGENNPKGSGPRG